MRDSGYTKQERQLIALLRVWLVVFFGAGIVFAIAPNWIIRYIEGIGSSIFSWRHPAVQLGNEVFWLVLVVSLMLTLSFTAYKAQSNILRNIWYTNVILVSKFISSAGFLVSFLFVERSFIYLTGTVVDGAIFLITVIFYHSALRSRTRI
jgi:uncharacterized membrane protein